MHELGIAVEIHRACLRAVERSGGGRIETVRVTVGELSGVEPDLLGFAWDALVARGTHHGSRLEVVWSPARQSCDECGEVKERARGSWLPLCPRCGRPLRVEGGRELDIVDLTFEPAGGEEASTP